MEAWRTISVALRADVSGYVSGVTTARQETKELGAQVDRTQAQMATGWRTSSTALAQVDADLAKTGATAKATGASALSLRQAFGGIALGMGLKTAINEFEQAQRVGAQTAAVIKSTGNAAQVSAG